MATAPVTKSPILTDDDSPRSGTSAAAAGEISEDESPILKNPETKKRFSNNPSDNVSIEVIMLFKIKFHDLYKGSSKFPTSHNHWIHNLTCFN